MYCRKYAPRPVARSEGVRMDFQVGLQSGRGRQLERRTEHLSVLPLLLLSQHGHDLLHHALAMLRIEVRAHRGAAHPASRTSLALAAAHAWATGALTAAYWATLTATARSLTGTGPSRRKVRSVVAQYLQNLLALRVRQLKLVADVSPHEGLGTAELKLDLRPSPVLGFAQNLPQGTIDIDSAGTHPGSTLSCAGATEPRALTRRAGKQLLDLQLLTLRQPEFSLNGGMTQEVECTHLRGLPDARAGSRAHPRTAGAHALSPRPSAWLRDRNGSHRSDQ